MSIVESSYIHVIVIYDNIILDNIKIDWAFRF